MRSIPRNLIRDQIYCVNYLVYEDESSEKNYCYLAIRKSDMPNFQRALSTADFDLSDFGVVLEEGVGEASDTIKQKMRHLYNCQHESAVELDAFELESA
jgi:hypothetical protein